ncbi:hypothetical protein GQ44DRAFT_680477 [Phaeosphaeriaceae sp. PMI808]|nr:hypothetical protein GQ44DRAFT_680477 [Phaeosphaeriaceae sp. PMI808]
MLSSIAIMSLPLVAAGVQHTHGHGIHHHGVQQRAFVTELVIVTHTIYHTITAATTGPSSRISSVAPSSSASQKDPNIFGNPFPSLVPVANSAMVKNSCAYPVYIWSVGPGDCEGPEAKSKVFETRGMYIEANGTYVESLRKCMDGGISLKISKTEDDSRPMQFEYAVNNTMVWYDISYLNCMKNTKGEKDLSGCAGHEGGIQAVGSGDCPQYHCLADQWCDTKAYVVAEFDYKPGAPVGACSVDKGIAFELCAGA